ncbi:PhzF family phenazine biosynthesis protein [Microbulbifer yueqingensis]|uniref:Phenazine biosynthesis protein PhzF family n=1 Tax=Microbulbifer yueqingensis TaxID=658219 RepID=A0A1G8YDT8_9GAMM|nr:PhzF family phenazine biosynthesis protein [Microbulbifer yueqingensis]SDK00385.1 phenazine biosynthesis protein PhzF family [Microbulbifer yueqingensis]
MQLPIYQADAFTSRLFSGNPAALVPLQQWLADDVLQAIAAENNLAETAFTVPSGRGFELRWFTPAAEVPLCGHATLASAHLLWTELGCLEDEIRFFTRSGELRVRREGELIAMDFPALQSQPVEITDEIVGAAGCKPVRAASEEQEGGKLLLEFSTPADVAQLAPDLRRVAALPYQGIACTATGEGFDCDFVSRFFAPAVGIDEDPVTGSAHSLLAPYWAARLDRPRLRARQISARGGELECELREGRVFMRGAAVTYLRGHISL